MKKYKIIYADPGWKYKFSATNSRFVNKKYKVMDKEAICQLPITEITMPNAALFLWITYPKLDWAFDVIKAWGFTYKTCAFTWIKLNKGSNRLFITIRDIFWGMGYYTRSNPELCLLATKGKPLQRLSHSVHSVIFAPVTSHSQKPSIIRNHIVALFGDLPRIELFARQKTPGWDVWGNKIESDVEL